MTRFLLAAFLFILMGVPAYGSVPEAQYWAYWSQSKEGNPAQINHQPWDDLLVRFSALDAANGVVGFDYQGMKKDDVKQLDSYIKGLQKTDPRDYAKAEQKAYWMNLYNALSVQAVLENMGALKAEAFSRPLPAAAWDKPRVKIARQKLSLNDISNRILRPIWHDHRVLFGLNCATRDCPNFAPRAYTARTLKTQLKEAADRFIDKGTGVQYENGILHASRLFKDYLADFAKDEKTLKKVFAHYARDMKALYFLGYSGTIHYRKDSRLNQI